MAYIVAKRTYQNEIVTLAESRMTLQKAEQKLHEIGTFPGQIDREAEGVDGELWIDLESEQRTIDHETVCFRPDAAHATLVRTGISADEATRLLSDDYARQWLADYYGAVGMEQAAKRFEATSTTN